MGKHRIYKRIIRSTTLICALFAFTELAAAQDFDLVILNGRVMDPETRYDAVANVGVKDGKIVLILDVAALIRARVRGPEPVPVTPLKPKEDDRTFVMVVDDSITMRKVTSRVLEGEDYEVITARDGVDALEQLQDRTPDIMLFDIEMPRMDGYELLSHIRADARLRHVHVSEHREARRHAAHGRVGHHRNERNALPTEPRQCGAGLRHLHQRKQRLLHPRTAACRKTDQRPPFCQRPVRGGQVSVCPVSKSEQGRSGSAPAASEAAAAARGRSARGPTR